MNAKRVGGAVMIAMSLTATAANAQQAPTKPKAAGASASASASASAIVIRDAWSRPALEGGTGVVYMIIENNGATAAKLSKATSPAAKAVEVHQSVHTGPNTAMHPKTDIVIASQTKYSMTPGNVHLMLINLHKQLVVGDTVPFTLVFGAGATVKAAAIVRKP